MALPDSFTASNGTDLATYDATWVKHGSYSGTNIEIQGNAAKLKAASGISLYYYNSAPSSADYSVTATLNVAATSGNIGGICARVSSSANTGYLARQNNNSIDLYKFVAGSFTLLGSKDDAITPPASPVDTLTVSGTSIIYVRNGVEKFNLSDGDISAAGFCGMRINTAATNLTIDDFDCDGIGGSLDITATLATATASGSTATVDLQRLIAATLGTASASGLTANVDLSLGISATVATAVALGETAQVDLQRAIAATLAEAVASGFSAAVNTSSFTQDDLDFLLAYIQENLVVPTAAEIAAAVLAAAAVTPIDANVKEVNDIAVAGTGVPPTYDVTLPTVLDPGDPWRPA